MCKSLLGQVTRTVYETISLSVASFKAKQGRCVLDDITCLELAFDEYRHSQIS
jgi:hypothetical protein